MIALHEPIVKLCGIRGVDDARAAVSAGADVIGIVMVPASRRYVAPPTANAILRAVREAAAESGRFAPSTVAVLGNMPISTVRYLISSVEMDVIQLVGDDTQARNIARVLDPSISLIRTISIGPNSDLLAIESQAFEWEKRGAFVIFDAEVEGEFGGTGHRIDIDQVRPLLSRQARGLAGGLTPSNVAETIREVSPQMVDVSSGIESHVGCKDFELMRDFVAAARVAAINDQDLFLLADTSEDRHSKR